MRRTQLHDLVAELVKSTYAGANADVAEKVLEDQDDEHGGFAGLCRALARSGGDTPQGVKEAWESAVMQVDDGALDAIADGSIRQPAIYLAVRA